MLCSISLLAGRKKLWDAQQNYQDRQHSLTPMGTLDYECLDKIDVALTPQFAKLPSLLFENRLTKPVEKSTYNHGQTVLSVFWECRDG